MIGQGIRNHAFDAFHQPSAKAFRRNAIAPCQLLPMRSAERRADDEPNANSSRSRHQYGSPFAAANAFLHLIAALVPVFRRLIGDLASHVANAGLDIFGFVFDIAHRRLCRGLGTPVRADGG